VTLACETLNVCMSVVRACVRVRACACAHVDIVVITFVLIHVKLSWSIFMDLLAFM